MLTDAVNNRYGALRKKRVNDRQLTARKQTTKIDLAYSLNYRLPYRCTLGNQRQTHSIRLVPLLNVYFICGNESSC